MAQKVTIGMQHFFLDFIVVPLEKNTYNALLGRGWLITAKGNPNWKKKPFSIENDGRKYDNDCWNYVVSQELISGSKLEGRYFEMEEGSIM